MPDRCDHPGRSGPRAANTSRARPTTTVPTAATARRPAGKVRPVTSRQNTAANTAAAQTTSRARTSAEARVGAAAQGVEHGDGPAQVGQPVDEPPRGEADPVPEGAGDQHGQQQVEGQRPEADVQRPVRGEEGDEGVGEADGHVAVAHRGDHVDGHEAHAEQRQVAVDALGQEPRPPLGGPAHRRHHPEHHGGGEQDQGHQPGRAGQVPQGRAVGRGAEQRRAAVIAGPVSAGGPTPWSAGQPAVVMPGRPVAPGGPAGSGPPASARRRPP